MLSLVGWAWQPSPALAQAGGPYPNLPPVPAQSARAFGDSVGVNTKLMWGGSAYDRFDVILARLRELGVRYVRDGLCPTCEPQIAHLRALEAAGIRSHLISGDLKSGVGYMRANMEVVASRLRGAVVSVEAPNEPDIEGGVSDWVGQTRAFQQDLYARVRNDPRLAHVLVLGPSVVHYANRPLLGDLSSFLDRGNIHPYPGGRTPLFNIEDERQRALPISGGKPLVATEAGYHADLATTGGHPPTSERATGIYIPRLALEGFRGGLERTYVYELADPWSEGERQARGISLMENSFGLLRSDLSPKPAYLALRNLLRATGAGSAPVPSPGALRVGLAGAPPDLRQLLLRPADGTFALVLWRDLSVWDHIARRDLFPAAAPLEVVLGEPIALAQRFDPVDSEVERGRWTNPTRIPVELAGAPVVLRLTPPGVQPPAKPRRRGRLRLTRTRKRQRLGRFVLVRASCSRCLSVTARGKLVVGKRGRRKVFKLKATKKPARARVVTLRLRVPPRARRTARKALRRGRRVQAKVTVTARSQLGTTLGPVRRTIVLVRRR
jgi:hypothetical protein